MAKKDKIDIKSFLKENEISFRETDTHYQVNCFICGEDRERLGIDIETGAWKCFNCNSGAKKTSSLIYAYKNKSKIKTKENSAKDEREEKCTIKHNLHLKFYKLLKKTSKYDTFKYLTEERKISKEAIKYFKLGARKTFTATDKRTKEKFSYDAGEHLAIPYLRGNTCVNLKYRALNPVDKKSKWRREKGGVSILFNENVLDDIDYNEIFITESELDTISLWELGIKNVVGLTTGANSFKENWYDRLLRFEKIYLVLDRDVAGLAGAKKIASRLGLGRCYNITLPDDVKDPNDFIKKYSLDDFNDLKLKAKPFEVEGVVSIKNAVKELFYDLDHAEADVTGFESPWIKFNKIAGKFKPGHLIVLCGKPKSGKTTWALDFGRHICEAYGEAVGMFSCEMKEKALAQKYIQMVTPEYTSLEDMEIIDRKYAQYKMRKFSNKLHIRYPQRGELELDKVEKIIEDMVHRYGIKLFIFDNLHFLCRGENEKEMIDKATQMFKLMAENLGITLFLITHPRKTTGNKQLKNEDLKGSSSIFQDADLVILMHRPMVDSDVTPDEDNQGVSEGAMSPRAEFFVTGRFVEGGKTYLAFDGRRSRFWDKGSLYIECIKSLTKKGKKKKGF